MLEEVLEGLPWACLPAAKPARLLAQPLACLPAAKPAHLLARPLACLPAASVLLLPSSAPSTQPLLHAASYFQCKQLMLPKPCLQLHYRQRRTRLFSLLEQAVGSEDLRSQRHRVQLLFDAIADERAFFRFITTLLFDAIPDERLDPHIFNTKS